MIETFEPGDTRQFTFQSSVAPDSAPTFKVFNGSGTCVASITSQQSDTNHYYALYTMPASADGIYVSQWYAESTVSAVSSAFQFQKSGLFNVVKTRT